MSPILWIETIVIDLPLTSAKGVAGLVIELESIPVPDDLVGQTCQAAFTSENNASVRQGTDLILSSGSTSIELLNVEGSSPLKVTNTGPLTLGSTIIISVRLGSDPEFSGGGAAGAVICSEETTTTSTTTTTTTTTSPRLISPSAVNFTG